MSDHCYQLTNYYVYLSILVPVLSQCFHSYSQLWLWPYGYDYGAYPDNWQELEQLAIDASDALYSVHGTVFDPINSADLCKLKFYEQSSQVLTQTLPLVLLMTGTREFLAQDLPSLWS